MTNAPAKVEPGDIGEGALFHPSGMPCCTLGHWTEWNGDRSSEFEPGRVFNECVELGEPMACALVKLAKGAGAETDEYETPADAVATANDMSSDKGRAEMWNAAVDVVEGKG